MEQLPTWTSSGFLLVCAYTLILFYLSNGQNKKLFFGIFAWSVIHGILAYKGFYEDTKAIPPRFALVILPATLFIIYGLLPRNRTWLLSSRNEKISLWVHVVRIPVELILLQLFLADLIPEKMTFEGYNFDILMGITAPIIWFLYHKKLIGIKGLIVWNCIGTVLIFTILVMGILSAELPIQMMSFDQPNIGVTLFPFVLLPALVVPVVIWTHLSSLVSLRHRLTNKD